MELMSIGTVLDRNQIRLMIIGYGEAPDGDKSIAGYYAVPYPTGLVSVGKVIFLPVSSKVTVIAEGFMDDFSEKLKTLLGTVLEGIQNSPEDFKVQAKQLWNTIAENRKEQSHE